MNNGVACVAEAGGVFRNRVQHRLDVSWRARDDAENCTGRGLLLQRLLEFIEQSDILNRDHRLVGEGL